MNTTEFIRLALEEDVASGDYSTLASIPPDTRGKAVLKIKDEGILAGIQLARDIFHYLEPDCRFHAARQDGVPVVRGDTAFEVAAKVHTILMAERLVLNCMQRMSGIATLTHSYVTLIKGYRAQILDTRKTTPLFRYFEKEAVRIGGGVNHRMGLYDMIMLKDNHIDFCGGIQKAIQKTKDYLRRHQLTLPIEVETRDLEDVRKVIAAGGVDRIMLDNFTPEKIAGAIELIDGRVETEASGGITRENIRAYAATGVDFISIGALTHQATSLDLSLKAVY